MDHHLLGMNQQNKPFKILHIITSLKIGGAEQALCNMLAQLRHQGNEHHVAYFYEGAHAQTLHQLGVLTYKISGIIHHYDPYAVYHIKKLIRQIQPDILHTSLWSANIIGRLMGATLKIPVISDLHSNCTHEGFIRNLLDRITAPMTSAIIAVSHSVERSYKQHILSTKKTPQVVVIENGIDSALLHKKAHREPLDRAQLGLMQDAYVIGAIGRLEPIKSYDILIKGFAQWITHYPHTQARKLVMVGGGSQEAYLKKLAIALGINAHIIFTGARLDAYRFYPLFNCFALSSQSEGLSLALLEAMSFGLPIISTSNTREHDVITDGINGFLVEPNNPLAIAQRMQRLYSEPSTSRLMQERNQALVAERFNIKRVAERYATLFASLKNRAL